jgi:hypothetical protein
MYSLCITHRINEDISWVEDLYADLLIYNKGENWDLPYKCYDSPKIPNEVDTYFRGIVESYDVLHTYKWIFLLKPNCTDYDPNMISYLNINQYFQIPITQIVNLSEQIFTFDFVEAINSVSENQRNFFFDLKRNISEFGINIKVGSYPCCVGNQYRVPTHYILCKSREWWMRLHSFANYLYEVMGQEVSKVFEILFPLIFLHNKINLVS